MRQAELIDGDIKTWVLGRAGENKATEVRIDITKPPYSEWIAQNPGGTWGILNAIPDSEVVYFVTVTQPTSSNQYVSWVVKASDIPTVGRGAMEVVYTGPVPAGSTDTAPVSKSDLYYTSIQDSLGASQDFPPAYIDWLTEISILARQAIAAARAIQDMGVAAVTLETGSPASVTKTIDAQGVVTLTFGLPKGNTGSQGPRGISISSITTARVGSGTRITITLDNGTSTYYDVSDGAVTSVNGRTGAVYGVADVDGYYETLGAGTADQLTSPDGVTDTPENDSSNNPFLFRTTAGSTSVSDGTAEIKKLRGRTIVRNQLVQNGNFSDSYNTWNVSLLSNVSVYNNVLSMIPRDNYGTIRKDFTYISGHKYYMRADVKTSIGLTSDEYAYINATQIYLGTWYTTRISEGSTNWETKEIFATATASGTMADGIRCMQDARGLAHSGSYTYTATNYVKNVCVFDLTLMYGAGNEPTTVEQFKRDFPLDYYAYSTGTLESVKTNGLKTVGFNQWDEEWEVGAIDSSTGQNVSNNNRIRSKNYIPCFSNSQYYFYWGTRDWIVIFYYDINKNYISYVEKNGSSLFTTPANAVYMRFYVFATAYSNNININLSWSGYRNGEYEAYHAYNRSIDISAIQYQGSALFPNGLCSAGNVYDEITKDKAIKRIGAVDLGTLGWVYQNSTGHLRFQALLTMKSFTVSEIANIVCPKYTSIAWNYLYNNIQDKTMAAANGEDIYVYDSSYTDAAAFKAAMSGVYLYYELATPIEVPIDPALNLTYTESDFGTEEFTYPANTFNLPVPAELFYAENLRDKLRNLNPASEAEMLDAYTGLN